MPMLVEPVCSYVLGDHQQPALEADGLRLRSWQSGDAPSVLRAFADPDIQQWHRLRLDDPQEAAGWLAHAVDRWATGTSASWAITENGEVVGQVGLRTIYLFEGQAELSYWTLPDVRGRRIATRAAALLTEWAFETAGLHRMELNHSTQNAASCRVATHLGYPLEGTRYSQCQHADGWHDMHLHARLARS